MAAREQTTVRFAITSATLTAHEIQTRLGLVPDESWKIGDSRGTFGAIEKTHAFVLESKEPAQNSLDEHVKAMLKRLAPYAQKIGALTDQARIEFSCILHRKIAPALKFERDDLRWLGVMGAQLNVDFQIISEPPKPAPKAPPATGTSSASF